MPPMSHRSPALDQLGMPYNGCGPGASAIASDKWATGERVRALGLPGVEAPAHREVDIFELGAWLDDMARPDGVEVTRARWFSRAELQAAVLSGEITISTRLSIARSLIEHWYGGVIEDLQQ